MEIDNNTKVGEVVRLNFKTAQLFEKYGIDFCCGGDTALSEACNNSNADIDELITEITTQLKVNDAETRYIEQLDLGLLCDYIIARHHSYVSDNIPFLKQKLQKLCDVHGSNHPELFEINELFGTMADNLVAHMEKEEGIVFPGIHSMVKQAKEGSVNSDENVEVRNVIAELEEEHQGEGERLGKINALSNGYTLPPDGCNTFQVTYQTLQEFEQDLHRHIHLENNILFKKAVQLEQELKVK